VPIFSQSAFTLQAPACEPEVQTPALHVLPVPQSVLVEQERTHTVPLQVALAYDEQSAFDVQVGAVVATWHTPSWQLRRPGKPPQSVPTVEALHWFAFVSTMSEHDTSATSVAATAPPTNP